MTTILLTINASNPTQVARATADLDRLEREVGLWYEGTLSNLTVELPDPSTEGRDAYTRAVDALRRWAIDSPLVSGVHAPGIAKLDGVR